jgi:hypothetical protein
MPACPSTGWQGPELLQDELAVFQPILPLSETYPYTWSSSMRQ